jgi:hypothetical protein
MLRQRTLTLYALLMVGLAVLAFNAMQLDSRTVREVNVWVKPIKFMLSTALFAITTVWFMGLLPEAARQSRLSTINVWILIATSAFEVAYITLQGARGEGSHYNIGDPLHATMYTLMGIAALGLTSTQAVLAWQIFSHTAKPLSGAALAVVAGLALTFVLGTASGFLLGGRQPPAGQGLPWLGWHLSGGDGRPAHFLGIHAHQIIPLAGVLLQRYAPSMSVMGVIVFSVGYTLGWAWLVRSGLQRV